MLTLHNGGPAGRKYAQLTIERAIKPKDGLALAVRNSEGNRCDRVVILNRDQIIELRGSIGWFLRNTPAADEPDPAPMVEGEI